MNRAVMLLNCIWLAISSTACLAEHPLRYDPFDRPVIESPAATAANTKKADVIPEHWGAQLRATLLAGDNSSANVDGYIIALGDSYQGFRLIRVYERSAVFVRGGKQYTLNLDNQEEDDEPQLSAIQ